MIIMIKVCPRCREALPADGEFFAPRDKHGHLDGWCRACRSEDQKARYQRRKLDNTVASGHEYTAAEAA